MSETCETCKFWDNSTSSSFAAERGEESGQCRRGVPGHDSRTGMAVWPFTVENDWCGEFKPTDATKPKGDGE